MYRYPSFFEISSVIRSRWVFTSLIRISAFYPKFKHYVTLRQAESCLGWASQSVYMKKSCPAFQGYPTRPRCRTTRSPELSRPRDGFAILM